MSINKLLTDVAHLMDKAGIEVILNLPSVHLQIIADPNQIEQVLINLIKNASEAKKDNEHLRIEIFAGINPDGRTYISIKDNGTGISSQVLERVFIPFFTTKSTGSGIGLSVSRQIMHMHRGSLTATSVEGKGSCFTLLFK